MKVFIFIIAFLSSTVCVAQKIFDTNFYYSNNKIQFEKMYNSEFDISTCNFITHFQILNDSVYVAQLKDSISINRLLIPQEFKNPIYARVTIYVRPDQYLILLDNIFWDIKLAGTVDIEELFINNNKKPTKKKYVRLLNQRFVNIFN